MPDYHGPQTYATLRERSDPFAATAQSERCKGASTERASPGSPSELLQPRKRRSNRDPDSVGSGLFNRGFRTRKGSRGGCTTDAAARTAAVQLSALPTLQPIASSRASTPEITPRASKTDKPAEGGASAHAPCESERSLFKQASLPPGVSYEQASRRSESSRGTTSTDSSVCPATGNRATTQQVR
jgi:hypothetical protein